MIILVFMCEMILMKELRAVEWVLRTFNWQIATHLCSSLFAHFNNVILLKGDIEKVLMIK